jgi:transposase
MPSLRSCRWPRKIQANQPLENSARFKPQPPLDEAGAGPSCHAGLDGHGEPSKFVVCESTILNGFWIHRALVSEGLESYVVDPASIAVSRRHRRAKTDRIDGEALVRTLLAYKRGEPRVCAMVRVPTPDQEDRRRLCRELKTLVGERVRHVNRLKGLFFSQGIADYDPRRPDRRERLDELRTGDGRPLPHHLRALALRELEVIELLDRQIAAVKAERDMAFRKSHSAGATPYPKADLRVVRHERVPLGSA